jgi:hypothetical protein
MAQCGFLAKEKEIYCPGNAWILENHFGFFRESSK